MYPAPRTTLVLTVLLTVALAGSLAAQSIGMVADRTNQVTVFNADTDTVIGTVSIPGPPGLFLFDCVITDDLKKGFVVDFFNQRIWVIDLTVSPPALATGINPIAVKTAPEDMALTPDQKYIVAGDGGGPDLPLSVVDVAAQKEIETFPFSPNNPSGVWVCPDNSVLVIERTGPTTSKLRRLKIDSAGNVTDTGESIPDSVAPDVHNVTGTGWPHPGGGHGPLFGIYVSRGANFRVGSFRVDGLVPVQTVAPTGPFGIDVVLSRSSTWLYVRTNESPAPGPSGAGKGFIDAFKFNPGQGEFVRRVFTIELDRRAGTAFGAEQTALHPSGTKLYVSGLALPEIRVYHAKTGAFLRKITAPGIQVPTGICVVRRNGQ